MTESNIEVRMLRTLIITPSFNTHNRADYTGAFRPESQLFRKYLLDSGMSSPESVFSVRFDNTKQKPKRREEVERLIWEIGADDLWDVIALFGHGLRDGLQTGHDLKTAGSLADVIAQRSKDTVIIPLYACDAGDTKVKEAPGGDGGMADALRDSLSEKAKLGHLDAHTTTGHTTINPYVRRFAQDGRGPLTGGHYLVEPDSRLWKKWRTSLKNTDLRFRYPFMTQDEIHAELSQ